MVRTAVIASGRQPERGPAADQDAATIDLDGYGRHAALVVAQGLARAQRNAPVVQRTTESDIRHGQMLIIKFTIQ